MPLNVAMFTVIPPGWTYTLSNRVKQSFRTHVNWYGNTTWPHVLDQLAGHYHLTMTIMWASHQVLVDLQGQLSESVCTPAAKAPVSPSPRNPFSTTTSAAATTTPSVPKAPPVLISPVIHTPPPVPTRVWRAETGQTLKDVIYAWAATADCHSGHWSVQWVTPVNYRIDAPLSFTGTWKSALTGIFSLYEKAATPLYAGTSTPQCLVTVDDKPPR
ncbi:toxin co-regulated pilus biosynthesis Q family protein [Scandinavium goeteborgense]|uniref:toxin co-regulated pilus biosynthesis Q family protein n=1 Tax=Scandinavium goeteborgense TaxID=1851514 RepID=UPI00380ED58C